MKLVWDTSSLSHAFEDFLHALGSAAKYCLNRRRCDVKRYLRRRFRSEYDSRNLLLDCDEMTCLIPVQVDRELMRNPQMRDELEFLVRKDTTEFVRRYGSNVARIAPKLFKQKLNVKRVSDSYLHKVEELAEKLNINISYADKCAIALAMQEHATLVTADRRMKELAEALGVPVIYTIPEI